MWFCIALAGCGLEEIGGKMRMIVGCVRLGLDFKIVATPGLGNGIGIKRRANPAVEGYRRAGAKWLPLLCFSFAVFVVAFGFVLLLLLFVVFRLCVLIEGCFLFVTRCRFQGLF